RLLYEALLQNDPNNPEFQHGLGQCHFWGTSNYTKAIEIWEKAATAQPDHAEYQRSLAMAYDGLAIRQNPTESLRLHQKALLIRERLVQDDPDNLENRNDLGATLNNIGVLLSNKRQYQEALAIFRRAVEHQEVAYSKAPQMILYGQFLGTGYSNIASMSWTLGQHNEALEWRRKSVTVFRGLVGDNPAVPHLRSRLWCAYTGLGWYQRQRQKVAEAALSARLARDVIERLPRNTPGDYFELARVHALCATLLGEGKTELTVEEKAERKHEADLAVKALQQSVAAGLKYVNSLNTQGDFDILRDRPDFKELVVRIEEAAKADKLVQDTAKEKADAKLKAHQEALAIRRKNARANPQNTQAQMNLAASLQALGGVQSELSRTADALKSVGEALAIRQALLKADPKNLQRLVGVAATEVALGEVEWNAGNYRDGARRWNQALARLDAAVQAGPQDNGLL